MEPITIRLKKAQQSLSNIEVKIVPTPFNAEIIYNKDKQQILDCYKPHLTDQDIMDYEQIIYNQETEEEVILLNCIRFYDKNEIELEIPSLLSEVREEVMGNIPLLTDQSLRIKYLNEVMFFYQEIESKIVETESGNLTTDLIKINDIKFDDYLNKTTYDRFLFSLKTDLRNEIKLLQTLINKENKSEKIVSISHSGKKDILWKIDNVDLIELVRSLKLIGAINNSTNNLEFKEAYKFFGDIFGIELKNPEDQLRQRDEALDTPNFIEKLLKIYLEDQKTRKLKRKS